MCVSSQPLEEIQDYFMTFVTDENSLGNSSKVLGPKENYTSSMMSNKSSYIAKKTINRVKK